MHVTRHFLTLAGLPVFALACSDTSGPKVAPRPANAVDVVIEFCNLSPAWMAVKNDGYEWTAVPTSIIATAYQLPVTPKVVLAYGEANALLPGYSDIHVFYLTADELASMICGPPKGFNFVSVPVAGAAATDYVTGSIGPGIGLWSPGSASMRFISVPGGIQDLVASRQPATTGAAAQYIVRHDVTISSFGSLPTLDFSSNEAVSPTPVMMVAPGGSVAEATFITNRGATMDMRSSNFLQDSATIGLIPATVLAPGDGFAVSVFAPARTATHFFTTPVPQTIAFGPALSTPTVTTLATSPSLTFRAELPSQPEYPSVATATFVQSNTVALGITMRVTVSAGYLGATPATWSIETPDLGKVIPKEWQFSAGMSIVCSVTAWDARMPLFFSKFGANDGETVRSASAPCPAP